MKIALIAAVADNGVIGRGGALPWDLPGDMAWFKERTLGRPIVMGRKTFESVGRPLPRRPNIVLTRTPDALPDGVTGVRGPEEALTAAARLAPEAEEVMIIGGAALFEHFLPLADHFYLTEVHAAPKGDVRFPPWDRTSWREVRRVPGPSDAEHAYDFVSLHRTGA